MIKKNILSRITWRRRERAHLAAACQSHGRRHQQLWDLLVGDDAGSRSRWSSPALSPAVGEAPSHPGGRGTIVGTQQPASRRRPRTRHAQRDRWGVVHRATGARARRRTGRSDAMAPGRNRIFFRAAGRRESSRASVLDNGPVRKHAGWGGGEVEQGHRAGGAAGPGSTRGRR
jgi:hypothetical protein